MWSCITCWKTRDLAGNTKQCGSLLVWEPGLPAMQSTRFVSYTEVMLSQASQLPHWSLFLQGNRRLAPLPTVTPESAGLCVWMGVSKVARSLNSQ
ncbi:hypothetical protein C1X89_00940 [Pseudomonas sp. GP01-A8]|nr:hypothetical protein C1X90_03875 [Pseudomonas sp. GP01-A9]PMU32514.1 hypothetical protein C1X88_01350 [Pseudomonas sp. GP01-A13]PMU45438.1 hypothetical protein C1X89_00940 [Pseudomonas sp. GP01-A8]PMU56427.1 hypothetical protein C1X87_01675 [Pseudomonas sp. GP01-A14]PMU57953.1 hypothetical protein C1X85_01820 [Pseudomonas sp. GP01-A6]PMU64248.1 hypothetical protein C1X86_04005 [Pseudomonas sp. GP01-A3]PMU77772.1 hypothetical protein C1X81_05590 [Pseudomonas sp. FW215-L2]PMU81405.1 hypothe